MYRRVLYVELPKLLFYLGLRQNPNTLILHSCKPSNFLGAQDIVRKLHVVIVSQLIAHFSWFTLHEEQIYIFTSRHFQLHSETFVAKLIPARQVVAEAYLVVAHLAEDRLLADSGRLLNTQRLLQWRRVEQALRRATHVRLAHAEEQF